jgi:hypothetical protein
MCFDGGLQKLTEHGRQGMRHGLYVTGPSMLTEIGDCDYDRVARLIKPSLSCTLGVYLFTTLCRSSAVEVDQLVVFGHLQRSRGSGSRRQGVMHIRKQLSLSESGPLTSLRTFVSKIVLFILQHLKSDVRSTFYSTSSLRYWPLCE